MLLMHGKDRSQVQTAVTPEWSCGSGGCVIGTDGGEGRRREPIADRPAFQPGGASLGGCLNYSPLSRPDKYLTTHKKEAGILVRFCY